MLKQWIMWLKKIRTSGPKSGTKGVFITCNDIYVPKAIIAIRCFLAKNPEFSAYIIGSDISEKSERLCSEYNIKTHVVDLSKDFPYLQDRPHGHQYPIECFYHFYAYKLLDHHKHIVHIEPDVFTNKSLTIDWNAIDFIGGSHLPEFTISKFPAIMKQKDRLESEFGVLEYDQPRLFGGLRIYNCRNLWKIDFYEQIKQIYNRSWMTGCPRCGDDSLSALYQTIFPEHFNLLPPSVNVAFPHRFKSEDYHRIMHFHFGGVSPKWWSEEPQPTELGIWYRNRFIEFTHNNFSQEFIKTYLPEIFRPYDPEAPINFYYWNGETNFGDLITPYFLKRFCNVSQYRFTFENPEAPKVLSCGSIMRLSNSKAIVYGSGIRDRQQEITPGIMQLVRGPLTQARVQEIGGSCPPHFGDPALVLPHYYKPRSVKQFRLGIIPHVVQFENVEPLYHGMEGLLVINLGTDDVEHVINQITACHAIVSASLHGLIVADAYGISNKWIQFDDSIKGDGTKYYDYFLSTGRTDHTFLDARTYRKIEPNEIISQINSVEMNLDTEALKEQLFFDENGLKPYLRYLYAGLEH